MNFSYIQLVYANWLKSDMSQQPISDRTVPFSFELSLWACNCRLKSVEIIQHQIHFLITCTL